MITIVSLLLLLLLSHFSLVWLCMTPQRAAHQAALSLGLVNINYHVVANFFLVMRMFKIYSLCSFQVYQTAVLAIVIMLYVTPPEIFLITENLCLWRSFQPAHSPAPPLVTRSSSMNLACWCFFVLISHISEIIRYLSFSLLTRIFKWA